MTDYFDRINMMNRIYKPVFETVLKYLVDPLNPVHFPNPTIRKLR
jgi:hypothetical protein